MRHLIVDGYNVIRAEPTYAALAETDLEAARARLVEDVAVYAQGEARAIVVFDGGANPRSDGAAHRVAGITVIFSRSGQDADAVIEGLAHKLRVQGHEVVVATSDAQTQNVIMGEGARRMSARELAGEISERAAEMHGRSGSRGGRLEDRIDERTRERLDRWARGM